MAFEIYSLRRDEETIRALQAASSSHEPIGLKQTHGLVASSEWWDKLGTAELPLCAVAGVVSAFWPGHHDDFPEFELRDDSGNLSVWPCSVPSSEARAQFPVGAKLVVEFVTQEYKVPLPGQPTTKLVIAIREAQHLDQREAQRRSSKPASTCAYHSSAGLAGPPPARRYLER